MPSKAVVMRFSAATRVTLAPDSLTIIPPRTSFVNTFFQFFSTNFGFLFCRTIQRHFLPAGAAAGGALQFASYYNSIRAYQRNEVPP